MPILVRPGAEQGELAQEVDVRAAASGIESLARLDLPDLQALPTSPALLAQAVYQIDGVHLDQLLDDIAPDPAEQQRALDAVTEASRRLPQGPG